MSVANASDALSLDDLSGLLDRLCRFHARVDRGGRIVHCGPGLMRICGEACIKGRQIDEAFHLTRPKQELTVASLTALAGRKIHLELCHDPRTRFKGQAVPLPGDAGALLDLSFGIGVQEAVADHGLTAEDFAPTDLAVEMLYLIEAMTAISNESHRLVNRLQGARNAAEERAVTDMLSGLPNRRALDQAMSEAIAAGEVFALMAVDLDHFKELNDTLGHAAGDRALRAVADVMRGVTRSDDLVARVGGDEFVLMFGNLSDPDKLSEIARRIIAGIETPIPFGKAFCRISASVGTTMTTLYDTPDADQMLADADDALYASKETGRARHTLFGEHDRSRRNA